MKITVIYGSARKNGSSAKVAREILGKVRSDGDKVTEYYLADQNIKPCRGCFACRKAEVCSVKNDDMVQIYQDVVSADFVIFSAPMYMGDVCGQFKLMLDRLYPMLDGPQGMYTPRHKGIKCCMVYAQGAPGIIFKRAVKTMNLRLKTNGFNNLGMIRETLTVDIRNATNNGIVVKLAQIYSKWQKHHNEKQIDKICKQVRGTF